MAYFDPNDEDDLALLPRQVKNDADLARVAAIVEYDVLDMYKVDFRGWTVWRLDQYMVWLFDDTYMCLRGWTTTGDDADTDAHLADAIRREVAENIIWRMAQKNKDPLASSESATESLRGKSYNADADSRLRPDFGTYLRRFDVRPASYVI